MADRYPQEFDSIRPYSEEELPQALQRLVLCPDFEAAARFVYPDRETEDVRRQLLSIGSITDFQYTVMYDTLKRIVSTTVSEFTWDGAEKLDAGKPCLFVSNHRDIALDAFLLQYILYKRNLPTCQITFGANLMKHPLVVEVGRINKMFRVERGGSLRSFYNSMAMVSAYMRYCITQRHESVWIAQRNGRTKNGIDATEPSVLKMFASSGDHKDLVSNIAELNIVPVSVSYDWEPCDWMKAREVIMQSMGGSYQKTENEDLTSIITGIMQPKGSVHITVGDAVTREDLERYDASSDGDFFKWLAQLVDQRIYAGYRLTANNYIAHDLRECGYTGAESVGILACEVASRFAGHYSKEQRSRLLSHLDECCKKADFAVTPTLLDIYANPVDKVLNL